MKKITFLMIMLTSFVGFAQPTSAPAAPTELAGDVISIFSDAYTSSATLNLASFTPAGNTSNVINAAGNDVYEWVITGGPFHGFDLSNAIDLTLMENLHYDIWVDGTIQPGAVFNTTVSYHAGGHLSGQTTGYVDTNASIMAGQEGQWLSFDVPFSDFAPDLSANPRDIISQLVFTHANISNSGPIYVDNIYFWKEFVDPNSDASLSDLTVNGTTVDGFAPGSLNYNVELPNGSSVPTVAGVATEAGNGSSMVNVTQAPALPGSATLDVTAPDGTTMLTYTVNFTEAAALPPAAPVPTTPAGGVIPILTNNTTYSDIGIPFLEPFGSSTTFEDLDNSGADDAFSFLGGNGGQINYFGNTFVDITSAGILHFDFYAETLNAADNINVVLLGSNTALNQNFRVSINPAQTGVWQSFEIGLNGAGSGLPDQFNGTANTAFNELALIQFIPGENGSTLPQNIFYISNIYFRGGTLSTSSFDAVEFKVFPNPTSSNWNITANNDIENVSVFNILGKEVIKLSPNSSEVKIDTKDLNSGVYFARLESNNGTKTLKLIKQ